MEKGTILVTGVGEVGQWIVEFLARSRGVGSIIAADRTGKRAEAVALRAAQGALQEGYAPTISARTVDLRNIDQTAQLIRALRPAVIVHAATLLSIPTMRQQLPADLYSRIRAVGFGPWLPLHMVLTMRLMQAVHQLDDQPPVLDFPFPDLVNPILASKGIAPLAGCGNVDNTGGFLRVMVARKWHVDAHDVHVYFVAPYRVCETLKFDGSSFGHEYYCRVSVCGIDVTDKVSVEDMFSEVAEKLRGFPTDTQVASSGVKNVLSMMRNAPELTHAPGPKGLPGGYPVRFRQNDVEVVLPPGLSMDEALRINRAGQPLAAIERIADDGTAYCTQEAVDFMKREFDYDARTFTPDDAEDRANALIDIVKAHAASQRS